jgi:ATP-dependent protease ClpP protease subunit
VASLAIDKSDSSSDHSVNSLALTHDVQGAVSIGSIDAQNIAVDGSSVSATNNYSVTLAGTAEENAKALNIVNSAGGMVANGVNIAHTANMNAMPTLTQVNSISQSR